MSEQNAESVPLLCACKRHIHPWEPGEWCPPQRVVPAQIDGYGAPGTGGEDAIRREVEACIADEEERANRWDDMGRYL